MLTVLDYFFTFSLVSSELGLSCVEFSFSCCHILTSYGLVGLRGAMAFALALQSVHDLPEGHGQTIFTATTAIVVLTVSNIHFIKLECTFASC